MKSLLFFILFAASIFILGICLENNKDPYCEGMHFDYSIQYENGYIYKVLPQGRGTIQVLNSDGTPLKVGHKIY